MRTIWVKNVIINECGNNSYYFLACYASCVCPSFLLRTRISQDANDLIQVDKLAPQHSNDYRFTTGKHYSIRYCHWSVSVEIVFPSGLFPEYANVTRNIRSFLSRVFLFEKQNFIKSQFTWFLKDAHPQACYWHVNKLGSCFHISGHLHDERQLRRLASTRNLNLYNTFSALVF